MNHFKKKYFYTFIGLHIISSLLFLSLGGYLYFVAGKNALESDTHYRLQHLADMKATEIIIADMKGVGLKKSFVPDGIELALIDVNGRVKEGKLVEPFMSRKSGYFEARGYNILVSDAPRKHLNVAFVVVQSASLELDLADLKEKVFKVMLLVAILMGMITWGLSQLFRKSR